MKWINWLEQRELQEMASKKNRLKNTTPPKEEKPMIIPADMKVGIGPMKPSFRTGVHGSKNKKRLKTRQNIDKKAIDED